MAVEGARTLRGALAGAVAAAVWAAQQPLDRKIFGVPHDDTELLGKLLARGAAWRPVGLALHLLNGAAFGAIYANVAPALPGPAWLRGPAAGLTEHFASWPLVSVSDRLHPARQELPSLARSRAAFGQATWRHLLYGVVLGEVERRLNAPEPEPELSYEEIISSNGHGRIEQMVPAGPPDD
jgi:hypothetical protein